MSDVTPPPPAPQPTPYASAPAGPKTNTLSIVALILSILWISIPAVICGHIAMGQIKSRGEGGRGLAIASLIIGYIGVLAGLLGIIFWVTVFGIAASSGNLVVS